jgi:hypothetical protein
LKFVFYPLLVAALCVFFLKRPGGSKLKMETDAPFVDQQIEKSPAVRSEPLKRYSPSNVENFAKNVVITNPPAKEDFLRESSRSVRRYRPERSETAPTKGADEGTKTAMKETQDAINEWQNQRELFCRNNLGLNDHEYEKLSEFNQLFGEKLVTIANKASSLSDEEFSKNITEINRELEDKVRILIGEEKLQELKAFRDDFNEYRQARFGAGAAGMNGF